MPTSQKHITPETPMGANLVPGGATFRVWAPTSRAVYVVRDGHAAYTPTDADLLVRDPGGRWAGFVPGVVDGDRYRFWVVGEDGQGFKRDPYARELELYGYPQCDCIVRDPGSYPWHDAGFRPPEFRDLILYQFHIGVFYARDARGRDLRPRRVSKFLDVLDRLDYLLELGVNAIQPLPVVEWQGEHSKGYNGTDLFSPEMDYAVDPKDLGPYLDRVNALLGRKGLAPLKEGQLRGQVEQLKAMIDVCHVHGLAVFLDVVYNHAGGGFDEQGLRFFNFPHNRQWWDEDAYFLGGDGWAGGRIFAFWKQEVRGFLIDNASMFAEEYHVDGFRYDEVRVIDDNGGWGFCQDLTGTIRWRRPDLIHIAEYWKDERWRAVHRPPDGMGFDAAWSDRLRDAVRGALAQAAAGRDAPVGLDPVRDALYPPPGFPDAWRAVNCLENHDLVDASHTGNDRKPRIAALADSGDARSWYARSRARVATGLLLTAPGIPMLFMGEEFLEDKDWSDDGTDRPDLLIWWDGLDTDRVMQDFLRFTRELVWLRRRHPGLRGEDLDVYHVHDANRVIAFHRWLGPYGRDVVVVASLNESTFGGYELGFPLPGRWLEVFNSDVYDGWVNPDVAGNGGAITADGPPRHGMPASATIVIPANGLLVFARDGGDS